MKVEVTFQTADRALQKLYNAAEEKEKHNIRYFGDRKVLVEGGGYNNIWLETQPWAAVCMPSVTWRPR